VEHVLKNKASGPMHSAQINFPLLLRNYRNETKFSTPTPFSAQVTKSLDGELSKFRKGLRKVEPLWRERKSLYFSNTKKKGECGEI